MKMRSSNFLVVAASFWGSTNAFLATPPGAKKSFGIKPTNLFALTEEETKTESKNASPEEHAAASGEIDPDAEGLPWWWELVWKLDMMQKGDQGEPIIFGDSANVLRTNIEQIYGGYPSLDRCPLAEGDIADIGDGTMFIGLQRYQQNYNSPFKLCFGPKSFLVISDPVQARHILRDANTNYDKGVLAEILEPIMVGRDLYIYFGVLFFRKASFKLTQTS